MIKRSRRQAVKEWSFITFAAGLRWAMPGSEKKPTAIGFKISEAKDDDVSNDAGSTSVLDGG